MSFSERSRRRSRTFFQGLALACLAGVGLLVAGFIWATSTPGESYSGPIATPENPELPERLESHVRQLASGRRNLDQPSTILSAVTYLSDELTALGYSVERQEVIAPADNLIINVRAKSADAPILIVGAHYDTAGSTHGADDNASGVAALLELARALKNLEDTSALHLQMVFYANEEPPFFKTGAMGSFVHAQSLDAPERVIGMISLETMGYFSDAPDSQNYPFPLSLRYPSTGSFIAFVGDTSSRSFLRESIGSFRGHAQIPSVGGTAPSIVQGIDWSDHWGYSQIGIPAFMITDTAIFRNPHYHRATDTPETLDYVRLALVVEALAKTLRARLQTSD